MGCDIHAYIEQAIDEHWFDFAELSLNRDYLLFGCMAGARGDGGDRGPVAQPRGVPKDAAYSTLEGYTLWVRDNVSWDTKGHRSCSRKEAIAWGGHWWDDDADRVIRPDWHHASWLTLAELEEVRRRYIAEREEIGGGYHDLRELDAIIAAMNALNGDNPNGTRLVFWFDN